MKEEKYPSKNTNNNLPPRWGKKKAPARKYKLQLKVINFTPGIKFATKKVSGYGYLVKSFSWSDVLLLNHVFLPTQKPP